MKHTFRICAALLLAVLALCALAACDEPPREEGPWANATYWQDAELGSGSTTILVEVKAVEQSVTFTVHTDRTTLGDALTDNGLIAGEMGPYGLYVNSVNGIVADYDQDLSYWLLCKNGEALMTGVDATEIADGEHYELVYTR